MAGWMTTLGRRRVVAEWPTSVPEVGRMQQLEEEVPASREQEQDKNLAKHLSAHLAAIGSFGKRSISTILGQMLSIPEGPNRNLSRDSHLNFPRILWGGASPEDAEWRWNRRGECQHGCLAYKKHPSPPGPPYDPRRSPTVQGYLAHKKTPPPWDHHKALA